MTTTLMAVGALVCGSLAAYLGYIYIQERVAEERDRLQSQYDPVSVVVANASLARGDKLHSGNVAVREIPRTFIHDSAVRADEWDRVRGRQMTIDIGAGEAVLHSHLARRVGAFARSVPPGRRAVTIPVSRESSIGGLLSPGDSVDLLMTMSRPEGGSPVTFVLLEDVSVAATDGRVETPARRQREPARTITIVVTPEQAARITHARQAGELTVMLRSQDDRDGNGIEPISNEALVAHYLGHRPQDGASSVRIIVGRGH